MRSKTNIKKNQKIHKNKTNKYKQSPKVKTSKTSTLKKNNKKIKRTIKGQKIYPYKLEKYNKPITKEEKKEHDISIEPNHKHTKPKIINYLLLIAITLLIISLIIITTVPKITFINKDVNIRYNTNYQDTDYKAKSFFKDYTNKVKKTSNINKNKIGDYEIKYTLQFGLLKITKTKEVHVIDDVKPELNLTGDNPKTICPNTEYKEEGYKAIDEYDGDITDKVITEKENNNIIYKVKDTSNNETTITREIIHKDVESPKIELKGGNNITLYKGTNYNEPGYSASDNCDGDITSKVEVTGDVNTNIPGTYTKTYKVEDKEGNKQEVKRQIKVVNPVFYNPTPVSGCVVYLTFDDGPSNVTTSILNTLNTNNIKATFFVTGNVDSNPNLLRREYNEGHVIALHTYSHNYSYLYSNTTNFFNDLDKVNNSIQRITGTRSNIIRFPGGSSNTVSKHYYRGIMTYLTRESINRGYIYFDWNVDSNDAGSSINNTFQIQNNVISRVHSGANIILMHDSSSHLATANALPGIVSALKSKGCSFRKIDNTTPAIRHGVNN